MAEIVCVSEHLVRFTYYSRAWKYRFTVWCEQPANSAASRTDPVTS